MSMLRSDDLMFENRDGGTALVLVADDEPYNLDLLDRILKRAGYRVVTAATGAEALEKAHQTHPDIVLLDIMMPEMDGQQALKMIREIEEERGILGGAGAKVVMLTALGGQEQVRLAFREQCEGYLVKPVTRDRLLRTVRELGLIPEEGTGS